MPLEKLILGFGVDDKVHGNPPVDLLEAVSHDQPPSHPLLIGLGDRLRVQDDEQIDVASGILRSQDT